MRIKFLIICSFCLFSSLLICTTWHIKQDGTGNFTTIQEGIIASSDSDTVLVYPGIYYENIDYSEKSLTVASLYIITPEDSLVHQTIIDGNQQASCVKIRDSENAFIIGFTLQNGYALNAGYYESYQGGGIFIKFATNAVISNCKIINNKAYYGGGVYISYCNYVNLIGNNINNNISRSSGGGISAAGNELNIEFDIEILNNIYLNYSATGSDINIPFTQNPVEIIVDTFTVSEPDYFYITAQDTLYNFSCINEKIEEIDQDLYVAPDGNDENSGLTVNDPLQTLAWAQTLIKRNDENPNTIHLAEGTYSPSLNDQQYPLNVKHGVLIQGSSFGDTILDGEDESPIVSHRFRDQNEFAKLLMKDLKIINCEYVNISSSAGGIVIYQADLNLENVIIENCYGHWAGAIQLGNGLCNINNVIIRDNYGQCAVSLVTIDNHPNPVSDKSVINSTIIDNHPNIFDPDFPGGGAFKVSGHYNIPGEYFAEFINCEISGNRNASYDPQSELGGAVAMYVDDYINVDIVNCTIGDNVLDYNTGCSIEVDNNSELNIYNSILYNNEGYSFNLMQDVDVNIYNSLIEGGDDNVNYYYPMVVVNWMGGNLDEDPNWDISGENPYALLENSPCINTGTLALPAGIELPEFDLAGNPRIYGDTIDMGAYEWQGTGTSNIELQIINTQITNYPNPFNPSTTIKLDLAEPGKIELAIYNIKGQKVKTLIDANSEKGHFEIIWRGVDDNGKKVSSGQYFIKLKQDGKETARKMLLLK